MTLQKSSFTIFLAFLLVIFQLPVASANEVDSSNSSEQNPTTEVILSDVLTNEESTKEPAVPTTNGLSEEPVASTETSQTDLQNTNVEEKSSNTEVEIEPVEDEVIKPEQPETTIPPYTNGNGKTTKITEYYFSTPNGFIKAGTLEKDIILTPTRITTNYFIIVANKKAYYIPKSSLTSTTEKSNFEKHLQGSFPRTIIAERDTQFKDRDGNVLGTIAKGKSVQLHMVNGGRGVVELFGKRVYVSLNHFTHTNLVIPNKNISHKEMEYYLKIFSYMYPEFTELVKIGASVQGRPIYALKVGKGSKEILMDGSMHAREHMTTNVLLEMIDEYSMNYLNGTRFSSYNVRSVLDQVSIWFVPMMNPDAVTLVQSRTNATATTKKLNNGSTNYNRWKANIRGVDLNRNFSVGWRELVTINRPSYEFYKGPKAFSEPEARALRDFMAKHPFNSYISYHSSGQVLYYFNFQNSTNLKRDRALAKKINSVTGYAIMPPTGRTASGVSADYFISTYKKPGITVEISPAVGPTVVPLKYWDSIWKKNKTVGLIAASEAASR